MPNLTRLALIISVLLFGNGECDAQHYLSNPGQVGRGFASTIVPTGDWLFVSAPGEDSEVERSGVVFIYRINQNNEWDLWQRLSSPDPQTSAAFGSDLSYISERLIVASSHHTGEASAEGALFTFRLRNGKWELDETVYSLPRTINTWLGRDLSSSDRYLAASTSAIHGIELFRVEPDKNLMRSERSTPLIQFQLSEINQSANHLATCDPSRKAHCQSLSFYDLEKIFEGSNEKISSFQINDLNSAISNVQFIDSLAFIGVNDLETNRSKLLVYDYINERIVDRLESQEALLDIGPSKQYWILGKQLFVVHPERENFNRSLGRVSIYDIELGLLKYKGHIDNPLNNSTSNFAYQLARKDNQLFVSDLNPVGSKVFQFDLEQIEDQNFEIERMKMHPWNRAGHINLKLIQPENDFIYLTGGPGIIRWEGSQGRLWAKNDDSQESEDQFLSMQDLGSQIIIGGKHSLNLFDKSSLDFRAIDLPNQKSWVQSYHAFEDSLLNIRAIYRSRSNDLWVGSNQRLYFYPNSNLESGREHVDFFNELSLYDERYIAAIQEDLLGRILVLVKDLVNPGGAIYRLNLDTNKIERFSLSADWGLLGPMHLDKSGLLWLDIFNPIDLEDFNDQENIDAGQSKLSEPWSITQDRRGGIWMASSKGLFHRSSTLADPVAIKEFSGVHLTDVMETSDGEILVTALRDVYRIKYVPSSSQADRVDIQITHVEAKDNLGNKIELSQKSENHLVFPSDLNTLSISFGSKTASFTESFEYLLENYDSNWTEVKSSTVNLSRLPSGRYNFLLRQTGGTQDVSQSFSFTVQAIWYLRLWAKILWLFLFLAACYLAYRVRILSFKRRQESLEGIVEERTRDLILEKEKTEEQAQALKQLDRAKNRFFANISHEFRTPLTSIIAPLKQRLASDEPKNNNNEEENRLMLRNAQSLLEMVTQILDLSKLESGRMGLDVVPVDLQDLVAREIEAQLPRAKSTGVKIDFKVDLDSDACLLDRDKMATAVRNLLSNAIKASDKNDTIYIKVWSENDVARISVTDEGTGIRTEDLDYIFERFNQLDYKNEAPSGTGIGLSLTKELVELHKGQLTVKSQYGSGSEFIVSLPFERSTLLPIPNKRLKHHFPPKTEKGETKRNAGPNILIVEDNDDLRLILKNFLQDRYRISEASDGLDALEKIENEKPDLILCDVTMPELDGFGLISQLKKNNSLDSIPVIFLTARVEDHDIKEGLRLGAVAYLTKPFDLELVEMQITSVLRLFPRKQETLLVKSEGISVADSISPFLKKVIAEIEKNISNSFFSIDLLGDQLSLSRRQLERKIRSDAGMAPADLIRQIRLERAYILLNEDQLSIEQIASKVGYNSRSHFSRLFKKAFGFSPSQLPRKVE